MHARKLLVLTVLLMLSSSLRAQTCHFGDVYVGDQSQVKDWTGSIEEARANPDVWRQDDRVQISRKYSATLRNGDLYLIGDLVADQDYVQGLNVSGPVKLRLNGEVLQPVQTTFYSLSLRRGSNVFELQVINKAKGDKKKGNRTDFFLTPADLNYVFTPVGKKIEYARRAIEFLGKQYSTYPASKYLRQLAKLESNNASDDDVEAFRYEALVINNPEVNFEKILFRASKNGGMPANWQGNANYLRSRGQERQPNFEDELRILDLKSKSSETVYQPKDKRECLMDLNLHYDADKLLFTGIDTESNTQQIYEINLDGSGKRKITPTLAEVDHYSATYLPNDKLLFCSTTPLNAVPCVSGNDYVGNLYEINPDGSGMRQITFDQENDWYPWVMENGRVMFCRWEYTDNAHYFTRILMQMNPDGTNLRSIYGSNSFWPNTMFYAKQIPGKTSQFAAICSGHHGVSRAGELIVFDTAKGEFEADGVVQRIPGYGKKVEPVIIDQYMKDKWPRFLHPYPLSENYFLVSGQLNPSERWSLYLVDRFDNMIKLASDRKYLFEPVPLKKRERPPMIPDRRDFEAEDATLFIQDIYAGPGLKDVPRGSVKSLRLFTYGYAYRLHGGHATLAVEGGWDTKRILGTVPVEEDGSVMMSVPHSLPISIQPLDENGRALQIMRSWLAAMPGERLSCVGCHESTRTPPPERMALAARKMPQKLTPWSDIDRPYGFGFQREVQPVLDRNCVGCHDGTESDRPNFKDNSPGHGGFANSYHALHPYVRRPGPESDMHLLRPMEYHASTSELIQMLEKGHHGVEIDEDGWNRLVTWIDLNVPYYATWMQQKDNSEETKEQADRTLLMKNTYACIDDDIEWMPESPIERPEFVKPTKVKIEHEPVQLQGWPLSEKAIREMSTQTHDLKINGQSITMAKIPAGRFVMGSVSGAADEAPQSVVDIEKPFWMSVKEITNEQYNGFDPTHDSGAIDQQWKDHIYAGYPANKPEMPAIRISWQEAMAYCEWASKKTGQNISLPTEAQWEWAARAGSDQPFYFGDAGFEKHANLADQSIGLLAVKGVDPQPIPVSQRSPTTDFVPRDTSIDDKILTPSGTGQFTPNPWGLFDMHGNVAEWTLSDYNDYPYLADDGRNALNLQARKVARGGSWYDRPHRATASYRLPYQSHQKVFNVGFRIIVKP
ncbi:Formylglycine-generating sulfatase enzyme [Planctomycetes bacterium CA13]|uniref:Formylglycine-generating sulfatase enzyme n=1 Tax=Novipirellula herctigrandis TaxID=2527986 RepID=A0A5C5Z0D0_9BACT|nr:Formylglycine-generating sulfatase enzyme [Planctomycetes bacterium CA13]